MTGGVIAGLFLATVMAAAALCLEALRSGWWLAGIFVVFVLCLVASG